MRLTSDAGAPAGDGRGFEATDFVDPLVRIDE